VEAQVRGQENSHAGLNRERIAEVEQRFGRAALAKEALGTE